MPRRTLTLALALLAALVPVAPGHAGDDVRLVVRLADGRASEVAAAAGGALGRPVADDVWRIRLPASRADIALARLRRDPRVVWAERDIRVRAAFVPNDPCLHQPLEECGDVEQWGLHKVGALAAWDVTQGDPTVRVAVLDTGVDADHPQLAGKVIVGPNRSDSPTLQDTVGHGTHVAGIVAAWTDDGETVAGLGWHTDVLSIKVLDDRGGGNGADVAQGIDDAVAAGVKVINMSFAGDPGEFSIALAEAVARARAAGVLVVAATGNSGSTERTYPAALDGVVSVTATDRNDAVPGFSNRGTWVSMAAPGVDIVSTWKDDGYAVVNGTSMAAPHVSAAAALLLAAEPGITADEVRARLGSTAAQVPATGSAFQWGRLDVAAALGPPPPGYWMVAADGGIFAFGAARFFGSTGALRLNQPVVGMAVTPTRRGYWLVTADGGIFAFGDARFAGSLGSIRLNASVLGMAAHPGGQGYWIVAADGGIFSFGDARFFGSTGALRLNQPIVGMVPTPTGRGYWLVARDGGIFSFGDARFFGSTGALRLNQPIVGMAPTASGRGYWLVASDGGMFAFGDARFFGSTGDIRLNQPIVGMRPTPTGRGYWLVARDGGIFSFGDAGFMGSTGDIRLNQPIVGMGS
jgi:hypothetical protein